MPLEPLVSVVIPVYNGRDYLAAAIDSALAQSYRRIEVLVVNDGSDDGGASESIARGYGDRIRYFSKPNGGVSTALNLGIEKMHGEYFAWLSHDDVFLPDKTARQVGLVSEAPDRCALVYTDFRTMDERGKPYGPRRPLRSGPPETVALRAALLGHVYGCTTLIHRRAFQIAGRFDETDRMTQDADMWIRLGRHVSFLHLPEVAVHARRHPDQVSKRPDFTAHRERFWPQVLASISDEDRIDAFGSKFGFFREMADRLGTRRMLYGVSEQLWDSAWCELERLGQDVPGLDALKRGLHTVQEADAGTCGDLDAGDAPFVPLSCPNPGRDVIRAIKRSRLWMPAWYAKQYLQTASDYETPLHHYLSLGAAQGFAPNPLFGGHWYSAAHREVTQLNENPLTHYLRIGASMGFSTNPLFSGRWYLEANSVSTSELTPLGHYLTKGAADRLSTHPYFDPVYYSEQLADGKAVSNHLRRYLAPRQEARIPPHPLFLPWWYLRQVEGEETDGMPPLVHFLTVGMARGLSPHPLVPADTLSASVPAIH